MRLITADLQRILKKKGFWIWRLVIIFTFGKKELSF